MASVKAVGPSGQISPGKEYAGRLVLVDQVATLDLMAMKL